MLCAAFIKQGMDLIEPAAILEGDFLYVEIFKSVHFLLRAIKRKKVRMQDNFL